MKKIVTHLKTTINNVCIDGYGEYSGLEDDGTIIDYPSIKVVKEPYVEQQGYYDSPDGGGVDDIEHNYGGMSER